MGALATAPEGDEGEAALFRCDGFDLDTESVHREFQLAAALGPDLMFENDAGFDKRNR